MKTLDADAIMARATPLVHQQAHEIQPFGHLVRMPIALSEVACKESVDDLNQSRTTIDAKPGGKSRPSQHLPAGIVFSG